MPDCLGTKLEGKWWRSTNPCPCGCGQPQIRHEWEAHGRNNGDVARAHGLSANALRKAWTDHGFSDGVSGNPRSTTRATQQPEGSDDGWLLALLKKHGDNADVEVLADAADVSPRKVRAALERLGREGFRVEEEDHRVVLHRRPPPTDNVHRALFAGERVRFGVVSDTHLGSKHERLDELHHAYRALAEEGITTVYHPGDLVCGTGIFPGQINEIHQHTYEAQVGYAVANYPHIDGVTTHLIGGNHDLEGAFGKMGANPCVAVANQRADIAYAGDYRATFELDQGTRIQLLHPKGGMGYAADYKVRKLAEGYEGGTKPNVLLIGHFHRRGQFEARGIQAVLCGCFEAGGSFGARVGLSDPAVGFHLVDMTVADDGSVVRFNCEWWRFWAGRQIERKAA